MKLGFMYVAGEGIPQDYVEGLKWFRLAADQGQANAQCFLGLMYFEGRGVPQNYVSDAAEYRQALTTKMTSAQVAEARRLACEWKLAKNAKNSKFSILLCSERGYRKARPGRVV